MSIDIKINKVKEILTKFDDINSIKEEENNLYHRLMLPVDKLQHH